MQQPDSLRRILQLSLGSAIALAVAPAAAAAAQASQVGAASYDRTTEHLSIPVKGSVPKIVIRRLAPRQFVADMAGSVLIGGEAQGQRLRSPALAGWSLDEEPGNKTVRLRMTLTTDVQPKVRFDRRSGGYVVAFATPADDAPVRSVVKPVAAKPVAKPVAAKPAPVLPKSVAVAPKPAPVLAKPIAVAPRPVAVAVAVKPAAEAPKPAVKKATWPIKPSKPAVTSNVALKPAPVIKVAERVAVKRTEAPKGLTERRLPLTKRVAVATKRVTVATKPIAVATKPVAVAARPRPFVHRAPVYATVTSTPVRAPRPEVHRTFVGSSAAVLGAPRWDAAHGLLVLPIESGSLRARDFDVYKLSARWSFMDIPHAKPTFGGVKYEQRKDPLFQRWVMAKRPGRDTTRLSFALGQPAHIDVEVAEHEVRIAVRPETQLIGAAPTLSAAPVRVAAAPTLSAAPVRVGAAAVRKPALRVATRPAPVAVEAVEAAEPIETRMRRPFYDVERFGLVVPYEGKTPLYRWKGKDEATATLELKADVVSPTHLQPESRRHGDFGSWTFGRPATAGMLAINMNFARPSEIVVAADPERKQLLLIPQPRLHAGNDSESAPAHTSLATVALDSLGDNLFIPFDGSVPRYTIEQVNPSFAYVNFERAALQNAGVQFYAPDYHPTLNYWLVTQPLNTTTVRIAVALARPGAPAVFQDRKNGRLVIQMGGDPPLGLATGSAKTPRLPEPWPGARKPAAPTDVLPKAS